MGLLNQWRRIVSSLRPTPSALDEPPPLPIGWREMSAEALWSALRPTARFEQPDPRVAEVIASGRPLNSVPLARWVLRQAPDHAVTLFAAVGYNLEIFDRAGTPEALHAALHSIPDHWSNHPVDTLATTPAWSALSRRGSPWFGVLATWATKHLPTQPDDCTRTERDFVDEGVTRIVRLLAQDASNPRTTASDDMALLYTLVSDPRWAQWVYAFRGQVVHWETYASYWDSPQKTPRFVPGSGWPSDVRHWDATVLLSHPLQALAHDQIWGSTHGARAYRLRGAHRWYQSLPKADHRLVLKALATWPGAQPGSLPAGLDAAALLDIFGDVPPEGIADFLKSPERTRREVGLSLMSRAAGSRGAVRR